MTVSRDNNSRDCRLDYTDFYGSLIERPAATLHRKIPISKIVAKIKLLFADIIERSLNKIAWILLLRVIILLLPFRLKTAPITGQRRRRRRRQRPSPTCPGRRDRHIAMTYNTHGTVFIPRKDDEPAISRTPLSLRWERASRASRGGGERTTDNAPAHVGREPALLHMSQLYARSSVRRTLSIIVLVTRSRPPFQRRRRRRRPYPGLW